MKTPSTRYPLINHFVRKSLYTALAAVLLSGCHGRDIGDVFGHGHGHGGGKKDICTESCIRISEAVSDNSIHEDQFGKSPDWFELYNYGETAIDLQNWSVSDDEEDPGQWAFPEGAVVPAGEYLLVWASDYDVANDQKVLNGEYHANFKISQKGETLYLRAPDGQLVDELQVKNLRNGLSVGRNSEGETVYYSETTPGAANAAEEFLGIVQSIVEFSEDGGVDAPSFLTLSGAGEDETIHYTLNTYKPTSTDPLYTNALEITQNTVVRAAVFKEGFIPSTIETRTYLPEAQHDLPVVTLVSEPENFFDVETGIYEFGLDFSPEEPYWGANFWQDWEREIHFAFYQPDGKLGEEIDGGVKIFGNYTRAFGQKSMAIYARDRYGDSEIKYPFFDERDYDEFQALVLRNSGNDWLVTMLRDAAMTSLMAGTELDYQAYQPVSVYLNGEYWGMYNLREKINEHFIASLHDVDPDELDIIENAMTVIQGDNSDFLQLYYFLIENSLESDENFAVMEDALDMENWIAYNVAQIYFDNGDWPGNNQKTWRAPGGKWRWVLFDTDFGFGIWDLEKVATNTLAVALEPNGPEWPNPPAATLALRRMVENENFRTRFINRFADYFNTRFKAENVISHIEKMAAEIESEMPLQFQRWQDYAWADWHQEINNMKIFAEYRIGLLSQYICDQFAINGTYSLTVKNSNNAAGSITLNSLTIEDTEWQGDYFKNIPITLTAKPNEGFMFSHWAGASESESTTISLSPEQATTLEAVFIAE